MRLRTKLIGLALSTASIAGGVGLASEAIDLSSKSVFTALCPEQTRDIGQSACVSMATIEAQGSDADNLALASGLVIGLGIVGTVGSLGSIVYEAYSRRHDDECS